MNMQISQIRPATKVQKHPAVEVISKSLFRMQISSDIMNEIKPLGHSQNKIHLIRLRGFFKCIRHRNY